jgi:hypothetical protein
MVSDAIIKGDPEGFLRTVRNIESSGIENLATAMCGWPAGLVLLYLAEKSDGLFSGTWSIRIPVIPQGLIG